VHGQAPSPEALRRYTGCLGEVGILNDIHTDRVLQENHGWLERSPFRDPYLRSHSITVAVRTRQLSALLGFSEADQTRLAKAALLHDIGKSRLPASILQKPHALSLRERRIMRTHPEIGYKILRDEGETDEMVLSVVRDHHERLDGSGYPSGKSSNEIYLAVRLVTVCDVFSAMTEVRAYCSPLHWKVALHDMTSKQMRLDIAILKTFAAMIENANHTPRSSTPQLQS
jgi:putative nucleotidyltransferase with HDIG domain